jgi:hypothetical protein
MRNHQVLARARVELRTKEAFGRGRLRRGPVHPVSVLAQ